MKLRQYDDVLLVEPDDPEPDDAEAREDIIIPDSILKPQVSFVLVDELSDELSLKLEEIWNLFDAFPGEKP